ncbi:MAG: DNA polymerase Y family protein [Pseudomonadales bacterium]|nr:DNA polymerase Y family protein [Pseudomonadales bacterium]
MKRKHNDDLWLCLHFPQLPVEIFTRGKTEKPVVVTVKQRITHMNSIAMTLGMQVGSSMDTAYVLCSNIVCFEKDHDKELLALNFLAQWAYQFTPNVALKSPASLLLDIKSSLNLFGGIENIKTQLQKGLLHLGYSAVLGVHHTPLAAHISAKTALPDVAPLHDTPIEILDVEPRILESLQKMGMRSLHDTLALPYSGLTRRFGVFFADYLQRLQGEKPDPQKFISEQPSFLSEITFLSDVTNVESLVFPIRRLLQEFCEFLMARQLKVSTFSFTLSHRSHKPRSFSIHLAEPESDAAMFLLLTQLHLEKINDVEEIDSIRLSARQFLSTIALSGDLFHGTRFQQKDGRMTSLADAENSARLTNILNARLGQDACFGLSLANDHRPEKAWKPVQQGSLELGDAEDNHRPLFLLPQPRALSSHNGKPEFSGDLLLLQGPERIDCGWWDTPIARDYYVARHPAGALYWIFQERPRKPSQALSQELPQKEQPWFLHGVFS